MTPSYPRPGTIPASMAASAPAPQHPGVEAGNLATIMEDENNVGSSIGNKENSGYSEENNGKW